MTGDGLLGSYTRLAIVYRIRVSIFSISFLPHLCHRVLYSFIIVSRTQREQKSYNRNG